MNLDQQLKLRDQQIRDIQKQSEVLAKNFTALIALDSKIYYSLQKPDCLFNESPIAPGRTLFFFRRYLAKLGFGWAIDVPYGEADVKKLTEETKLAGDWVKRFEAKPVVEPGII